MIASQRIPETSRTDRWYTPPIRTSSAIQKAAPAVSTGYADLISDAVKFVFSWLILMPIAIIVGGRLYSRVFYLGGTSRQLFRIRVPPILDVSATDDEVILGFTGLILCLLFVGLPLGPIAYTLIKRQFGIDPGQFDSLCVFSAFLNVALATTTFFIRGQARRPAPDSTTAEYQKVLKDVSIGTVTQKQNGTKNDK